MSRNESIDWRDDLHALSREVGIDVSDLIFVLEQLGKRESHVYVDGHGRILPAYLIEKVVAVSHRTFRREPPHSHPNNDHSIHPLEEGSCDDRLYEFRDAVRTFRGERRKRG